MRPPMTDDELMHFGIKGMKWGVRRFQNPDGTRTPAGLKRYGTPRFITRFKDKRATKRIAAQQKSDRSRVADMSDEELDKRITRLRKEKELLNLMEDTKVQEVGKKKALSALKESGTRLLKDASYKAGMSYVEKFLKGKDTAESWKKKVDKLKYASDKLKYDRDKWKFDKDKKEYSSGKTKKNKKQKSNSSNESFYYQPKPASYPQLPGPTVKVKKKKKK